MIFPESWRPRNTPTLPTAAGCSCGRGVGGNTEGPLWHPDGYLTFVSLTESRPCTAGTRPTESSFVSLREGTGEGNGCTFDRQGRLIMCEGAGHRRITRMDPDGTVSPIAERWQGKRLHKPNDVVTRSDHGSIYFTDPEIAAP